VVKNTGKQIPIKKDIGNQAPIQDASKQLPIQDVGNQAPTRETGKQIAQEAWRRSGVEESAKSRVRAQLMLPAPIRWLERLSWIVPIVRENTAPLVEGVKAKLPKFFKKEQDLEVVAPEETETAITLQPAVFQGVDPTYRKYRCVTGNTLGCEWAQKTLESDAEASYCEKCGFPVILAPKAEFRGYRGRYRIEGWLGNRGMGRLYRGVQVADQQPVVVKEYLLPEVCFNPEETRERKQTFERLAGLSLTDGRIQDIRLNAPWDAVADPIAERCYLVTNGNQDAYPTLGDYLKSNGAMTAAEVRRLLDQVLQTLQFLHGQKFSLPSGQIQRGISHGNLNLDSLLIMGDAKAFFIHVSDLAIWERLFDLPTTTKVIYTLSQDLVNLGYVAFYMLRGTSVDSVTNQQLNPKYEPNWQGVEPELKRFIQRLLEIDVPFASAEEARQALLQLPVPPPINDLLVVTGEKEEDKTKLHRPYPWIFGLLGLLLLTALVIWIVQQFQKQSNTADDVVVCCLEDVAAVPPGKYTYTGEKGGTWSYIQQQSNLILQNQTLEEKLKESQPKLELNYRPEDSPEEVIAKVQSEKVDFAITNLVNQITPKLRYQEVAYDGLVIFVAFSYSKREKSLPRALNGQISFEQLRDLYTGKITNWNQLKGANLPNLPVKLYMPIEKGAIQIFEERVLQDSSAVATFRQLQNQNQNSNNFVTNSATNITSLPTIEMLRQGLRDFEEKDIGSIGFATLSQVFGQCSAYPLAVTDGNKPAIQSLIQDNGIAVNPNTDLCDDKGNYRPNIQVFKTGSYPLGYPIVVVYPGDNSRPPIGQKFADMLRTAEIQRLLEKAGLVPLQPTKK
jgi:ABC-type phosphate transport system substrate-binding protein